MPHAGTDEQSEVIAFLLSAAAWPRAAPVTHVVTHGAHVFLCGEVALKIKRAVHYDYMDLSTLARRKTMLRRELALNRAAAPMIYRDVVAVTRGRGGQLALAGDGPPVEWVLRMHRFQAKCELTVIAERSGLTDPIAETLGQAVYRYHASAPRRHQAGDRLIGDIIDELARVLADFGSELGAGGISAFLDQARHALADLAPTLRLRSGKGHVRRAHGDLHLGNLVLIEGRPVLFDALEFDERLGTCDVLYDLAFLVMDLCHRHLDRQANMVLNAYLLAADGAEDAGLGALPLFLAVRAAIRAMVGVQTDRATASGDASTDEAKRYLSEAIAVLQPEPPALIAIGGVSGSGKTVLARAIAPIIGACPGAIHLRTDTERKARAAPVVYTAQARSKVYRRMMNRARAILGAGRSVVLDGTFLDPAQTAAAEALAASLGLPFRGLWLSAPEATLVARVTGRRGDASDADTQVVRAQLADPTPTSGWIQIDASGAPQGTSAAACAALVGFCGKGPGPASP